MNTTLTAQLVLFVAAGAILIAVSLQVNGDYDVLGHLRELLGTGTAAS